MTEATEQRPLVKLRLTPERVAWAKRHVTMAKLCGLPGDPLRKWVADAIADMEILLLSLKRLSEAGDDTTPHGQLLLHHRQRPHMPTCGHQPPFREDEPEVVLIHPPPPPTRDAEARS